MTIKIDQPIVGQEVLDTTLEIVEKTHITETTQRPEVMLGTTYKVKPSSDKSFYITINDMVLDKDTEFERRRPFEIFINSKNIDHYQWVSALTLIISAVFRKGGDATFLVDELKEVFDPKGGYFKPGGRYMPSIVAELGYVLEQHLMGLGLLHNEVDETIQKFINDKKEEIGHVGEGYPVNSVTCPKCSTKATVMTDGCSVCLACGDSKCS